MKKLYFILSLLLLLSSCEPLDCPMDESRYPYKGQGSFTAEKLVGIWQCYYPMTIEGIEFKEIYIPETVSFIGEDAFESCYFPVC